MITGELEIWETEEDREAKKDGRDKLIMAEPDMEEVVWVSKVHGETRAVVMEEVMKIGILQQDMVEAVHHQDGETFPVPAIRIQTGILQELNGEAICPVQVGECLLQAGVE